MTTDTLIKDPTLGELFHKRVFRSGLTAYVFRKPEFTRSYATLATRYGSVDTTLHAGRGAGAVPLPAGIAHFLEHKVFETPEGDAFNLFAARGASANAFTTFSSTRYLFGTSQDFAANLRTLISVVFDLHVNPENVEKEKGIIDQEIAMYADDPDWQIYIRALRAMYARHPVRIDIAGTSRSIAPITDELLRRVHATYYHPRNMVLSVVSPEPVEATYEAVEELIETRRFGPAPAPRPDFRDEPARVRVRNTRIALPVKRERLLLAIKDRPPAKGGKARLRHEMASAIGLECLFGNSGSVYLDLYERGLVDDNFASSYTADQDYAFAMLGGETDDAAGLKRRIEKHFRRLVESGVEKDDFQRVRNKELGGYARAFNSPERVAHMLVGHHFRGTTVADYREQLFRITRRSVNRRLAELLDPERRCYSIMVAR